MQLSKSKHTVAMLFVGIGLLVIMSGLIVNYYNYQYQNVVATEREQLATVAEYLNLYFDTKLIGLKVLAGSPNVRSLEVERVRSDLLSAAAVLGVDNVAVFDPKGNLIADYYSNSGSVPSAAGDPKLVETFAAPLAGQTEVSGRIVHQSLENAYINLRVPVMNENKVIAILVAYVPISDMSMALFQGNIAECQYIFILDASGQFIYHSRLAELYPENSLLKDQLSGLLFNGEGVVQFNSMVDGVDKLLIHTALNNATWQVATAVPLHVVYARVLRESMDDVENLLLLLVCIGLLYGVWRQAKRHEREREQLRLERMKCVNQLAAGIAHEIRNPLTSIKGFIQLMARRTDKPPTPEHLEIVLAEIGRIDNLISEFQMLARPLKEPVFEEVNICKLLENVVLLMESQLHTKNITLQLQLPQGHCLTFGDISQLKQVFINLLKNAIEAVPFAGIISLAVSRQQDMLAVTVEDNGEGIAAAVVEKLGTPFFTTKETGSGLGLSVCYRIIQNHGGTIKVFSEQGKTTFTVFLPAAVEDEAVEAICC